MRNYSKVAAAVAIAIGSGSALAASPTWTVSLNVAGSSAFRDAFANELSSVICQSGTFASYTAAAGTGSGQQPSPDFRAYTCNATAASGLTAGTGIIVYYRSEGGSIFGVFGNSTLNGGTAVPINSLNIGTSGNVNAGPYVVNETVAQLQTDTQTGAVQKQPVQLGISDVNPTAFIGTNYGSEYTFGPTTAPTVTQLAAVPLQAKSIVGQVFAPIVSNAGATAGFASSSGIGTKGLTSQEIASIISGAVSDWSLVPSAAAAGATAPAPITICRRDAGSGTQVITSTHFLGTSCSSGGLNYVSANQPGVTVVTNYSTSTVLTCVKSNPGSIGFVTLQPSSKYTSNNATQITVDGLTATALAAAQGQYSYYGEAYAVKDTLLTGNAATLANKIVSDLLTSTNLPTNVKDPNLVAVPSAKNPPAYPVVAGTTPPIAIGSTNGNVCAPMTDVLQ